MTVRGVVKGNVVVLEENGKLPEGATVEVRVIESSPISRDESFARVLRHREGFAGRRIGMDEIIEEEKREREEYEDRRMSEACVIETADPDREAAFARIMASRARKTPRQIGIDEIIEADKQDREERVDAWLRRDP